MAAEQAGSEAQGAGAGAGTAAGPEPAADARKAAQPAAAGAVRLHIVIAGHVDHGKSTVVGRLLADAGALPDGKLEQVRARCERNAKPFEYAFLLDALQDEQDQGITIDAARVFFDTAQRGYLLIDAPGHVEFVKNMATGASRAEGALLVIDASEGVQENSRRHAYLLSLLGVRQVAVIVNKMDLVGWEQAAFERIATEIEAYLDGVGIRPRFVVPASGREGDGVAARGARLGWYEGPTVLGALEAFDPAPLPLDAPFRMPVQGVYKFTQRGDDRRIIAGTVSSGRLAPGDEVIFYPSGKRSRVRSIESFAAEPRASAGRATGFTLTEQIYVQRGDLAARADEPRPAVTTRLRATVFWLGRSPLVTKKEYAVKLGAARLPMRIEAVHEVLPADGRAPRHAEGRVERHEVAECTLRLARAAAFDAADAIPEAARFVIVDDREIRGGGVIREALADRQAPVRDKVLLRNYKWESSIIPRERRAARYSQRPTLLLVTGAKDTGRKPLAKELEARLFQDGRVVYFLGIGNVLYGVDADLERGAGADPQRGEHIRRMAEVAHILLDAGAILIVTAQELTADDLDVIRTAVDGEQIEVVWVGPRVTTDVPVDLQLADGEAIDDGVDRIRAMLAERGIIFRPW